MVKTTWCLGIVESNYKSKKEGLGTAALSVGLLKPVSVLSVQPSALPHRRGNSEFKEEDTPIFKSNEHLHWLTPFLEFRI